MCELCRQIPCHPRCPNASDPKPVYVCTQCGYPIIAGDKYMDIPDGKVCKECIEGMPVFEFMKLIGEEFSVAS